MEMVDFVLGFAGIDIAGDDGYKLGQWPWAPLIDPSRAKREPQFTMCTRCGGRRYSQHMLDSIGSWSPFTDIEGAEPPAPVHRLCKCVVRGDSSHDPTHTEVVLHDK